MFIEKKSAACFFVCETPCALLAGSFFPIKCALLVEVSAIGARGCCLFFPLGVWVLRAAGFAPPAARSERFSRVVFALSARCWR
jgi:hypothetical protein